MDNPLRVGLLIYVAVFLGAALVWPSYRVWRRTGVNPYVLTRADELAVVSSKDKAKLEEMIRLEWRLNQPNMDPLVFSAKGFGKQIARSNKRLHEI